jgi:dTDP-4-amino-4,6-dideoxygalactose transaminase
MGSFVRRPSEGLAFMASDPDDELPALLGGPPVRPEGPPDWPPPDPAVAEAVAAALRDGSWGKYSGGHVDRLEQRLAHDHAVAHARACGSGTFAVELALRAVKVGPGDEVVLAAYDYGGNFLCVHAVGAVPVLVDVVRDTWNLDPASAALAFGPATKAVIVSHLHGGLVPMAWLMDEARRRDIAVIEDAAQCPGAMVEGRRAGTWGDVGVLSFGGSKLLTAGRGGAILTPHADVHQRARLALHRGNVVCPLSELQAAALLPQLDRLDERNARRRAAVARLTESLRDVPGLTPFRNVVEGEACYYKVGFRYDGTAFGLSRARFVAAMRAEGIAFDEGFRALHVGRSPSRFRRAGDLGEADQAHVRTVVLHHPVLLRPDEEVEQVARAVKKVRANAARLT